MGPSLRSQSRHPRRGAEVQILLAIAEVPAQQAISGPAILAQRDRLPVFCPAVGPCPAGPEPYGPSLNSMPDRYDPATSLGLDSSGPCPATGALSRAIAGHGKSQAGAAGGVAGRAAMQ